MDRKSYKAGRRMIIAVKLGEMMEGLYGLRRTLAEEEE